MAAGDRYLPTAGGTLFHLAAQHLGVAEHWTRIAAANGMDDPWLSDVRTMVVPRRDPYADRSGILYPTFRLPPKPVVTPDPVPDTPPVPQPPVRSFRFDRMAGPFRFDATGPDAPTFDQIGLLAPPGGGGGGGFPGPVDPPPVDPPPVDPPPVDPPPPVLWSFDAASGVTFDAAVGYTFDEGPPETVQTITFDKTTGTGFDATTGPGFDQG